MSINRLHDTWFARILQLWPQERITRLRNLAWLLVGIWASRSVHLSRIAGHIPGAATQTSLTRRVARLLDNAAVLVRVWYQPLAQSVLQSMATAAGEIWLIADASEVGFHHQLLMVALAYRRRMWIEEMLGDLKGHGFDLEKTHLVHFERLSRLTLAVVLLYLRLIVAGTRTIQNGQRGLVDRADRRDLSVFQIGLRWVLRCLTNAQPVSICLSLANGYKLSGS